MEFDALQMFLKVGEEGGFSRAATRLGRTQPAVSQAIKRLEEELGTALFDRGSRGGRLTEAGRCLLSFAQGLLQLREEAVASIAELNNLLRGRLALGTNESTSQFFLPPLLGAYRRAFPHIKVEVFRSDSERIPALISERNLDLGFLSHEPGDPRLETRIVHRDYLQMVVHPGHPLAGRSGVDPAKLAGEVFLAHNAKTPSRTEVVRFFAQHRIPLNIVMELDNLHTIKRFVAEGLGAAILPGLSVAEELRAGSLCPVAIRGLEIRKDLRLVMRKGSPPSPATQAFLKLLGEVLPGGGMG